METVARLVAGILLVAANAFFVATEFALTRLRQFPEEEIQDDPGLRTAWEMTERLEIHLTGCQLGISASSILLGVVAEPAVTHLIEPAAALAGLAQGTTRVISVVVAIIFINLVHKIWGEQAPTYLGVERPKEVARHLAPALRVWSRVMSPIIRLGDGAAKASLGIFGVEMTRSWTEEVEGGEEGAREEKVRTFAELRREMGELLSRGEVSTDRREEILQALAIGRIPVRRIMVPREEISALSLARSLDENLGRIAETRYARYPLLDEDEERFAGTVYVPALFPHLDELRSGETSLRDVAAPGIRVDADLPVSELIDRLQEVAQEVALVEEEGRVVGLVTITDAFEEIAGEVEDPLD